MKIQTNSYAHTDTSALGRLTGGGGWAALLPGVFSAAVAGAAGSASPSAAEGGQGMQSGSWMKKSSSFPLRLSSWKSFPRVGAPCPGNSAARIWDPLLGASQPAPVPKTGDSVEDRDGSSLTVAMGGRIKALI